MQLFGLADRWVDDMPAVATLDPRNAFVEQAKLISEFSPIGANKHDAIMGHPSALIHREFPSPTRSCLTVWPVVPIQVCKTLAQIACEERQTRALIQVKIPSPVTNSCSSRRDSLMKHVLVRNPGG